MSDLSPRQTSESILSDLRASLSSIEAISLPTEAMEHVESAYRSIDRLSRHLSSWEARVDQTQQESVLDRARFISIMTHELRLPMTSIKGYTDLLRQGAAGPVNEQQLSFLIVIRNNIDRMTALISDLSDISRMDSGRLKVEILPLSLMNHLDKALKELHPILQEKGHLLKVEIPETIPPVLSDPNRLVQILANLIRNACMYTPENGLICIQAAQDNGMVRLEVSDNGIGIKPEDLERLFTPFYRSDDVVVREQHGWGLGLYVVSRLVKAMGGSLGAQSDTGKGSTFWFTLPAASV
jgi:signal transduction histidine kinase